MKLSQKNVWITGLLAAACAQSALPQAHAGTTTWRCGNAYSDRPCTDGKSIDLDDARNAAQRQEADSATREARMAADRMERDRVRLESVQSRRGATLIDNAPMPAKRQAASPVAATVQKKKAGKKDPAYFSAHDPVATAKKKAAKASKS